MLEQKSGRTHIKPFRSETIPGIISLFLKNFSIVNMVYLIIKHTLYLIKEKFHLVFWLQFHTCKIKQGILSLRRTVSICPILDRHQLIATKKLHKTVFTLLYLIKPFNQPHTDWWEVSPSKTIAATVYWVEAMCQVPCHGIYRHYTISFHHDHLLTKQILIWSPLPRWGSQGFKGLKSVAQHHTAS